MKIHVLNPNYLEPWTYTALARGIGGSETAAIEMATRFAARGHDVTCYTRLPAPDAAEMADFDPEHAGVHWRDLDDADLLDDGIWWVFRSPETGLRCVPAPGRVYYLFCEDVFYHSWSAEAVAPFQRIFALCPDHQSDMEKRDPSIKGRVVLSSNGVNVEAIEQAELEVSPEERNTKRLIWTSSPDRGLKEVLDIFERAREIVPDLELYVMYGMDNIETICEGDRTRWPWVQSWRQYDRACAMPGVTWHGRMGQGELKRELFKAGIWLYPTWFCVTGDTRVDIVNGPPTPIADLVGRTDFKVWCFDESKAAFRHAPVQWVKRTRENVEVWCVTLRDGTMVRATPDHKFLVWSESYYDDAESEDLDPFDDPMHGYVWKRLRNLDPAIDFAVVRGHADQDNVLAIASVAPDGTEDVYDLLVDGPHNFVANGVVVHNSETSCISCMEAQACGCIPITRPFWAVGHNVRFGGIFVEGEPNDPLVKARYVAALANVATDTETQERVRAAMMPAARECFDWERWVDQWSVLAAVDLDALDELDIREAVQA